MFDQVRKASDAIHGDVHALASLMEAVTGGKVTSTRIIEPSR